MSYQLQIAEGNLGGDPDVKKVGDDTVANFLKRYNKDSKFDFILNYRNGGDLLFQNPGLDITADVLKGLNADYKKHNQGKK